MVPFIAAAAAFTAPLPVNPNSWFAGSHLFPHPKNGVATVIASEIVVNRHGYIESCSTSVVFGNPGWGPFTCQRIQAEAKFRTAKLSGQPVYGIYRLRVTWDVWPAPADAQIWDFEAQVGKTDAAKHLPALGKIQFVVDSAGKIDGCSVEGNWESAELASVACAQLPERLLIRAVKTKEGEAVPSVQDATVRFVAAATAK